MFNNVSSIGLPDFLFQHAPFLRLCENPGMCLVVSFLSVWGRASSSSEGSWGLGCLCVVPPAVVSKAWHLR